MVSKAGQPFTFAQSVKLIQQQYRGLMPKGDPFFMPFILFLQLKFVLMTFLLGALRSVQFSRFNQAGMEACEVNYNHRESGVWKPYQGISYFISNFQPLTTQAPDVDCIYSRAKTRNGARPTAPDRPSHLTITCTCKGEHEPFVPLWLGDGRLRDSIGQSTCWFNLFVVCTGGLDPKSSTNIMRWWNTRQKEFGTTPWSAERLTGSIRKFCLYCGIDAAGTVVLTHQQPLYWREQFVDEENVQNFPLL